MPNQQGVGGSITGALLATVIADYLELWDRMNNVQLNDQVDCTV